jgi:hypothetical protein
MLVQLEKEANAQQENNRHLKSHAQKRAQLLIANHNQQQHNQ